MTSTFPEVETHGCLQQIIEDVWYLTGSVKFKPLLTLSRNMIIIRHGEELTLINSVRLNAEGEKELDALGRVAHVMKIGFHGMDDAYYLNRYDAKYWHFDKNSKAEADEIFSENTKLPFPNGKLFVFNDTVKPEAAILIERDGGLLITCDSIQHWVDNDVMSFLAKLLTRFLGFQKPAQIGPPWQKKQTPPGGSLKPDFERLTKLPFNRLIGGHGGLLETNANELLKLTIERELS